MILNKFSTYLTLFSVLTFISCDPSVSYNKIIENNSDYDLKFKVYPDSLNYLSQDYKTDTFVILKHTEYTIIHTSRMSQTRQYQDCNTYSDSISCKIIDYDSLHLAIHAKDEINWKFKVLKETFGGGGNCECRLLINNDLIR